MIELSLSNRTRPSGMPSRICSFCSSLPSSKALLKELRGDIHPGKLLPREVGQCRSGLAVTTTSWDSAAWASSCSAFSRGNRKPGEFSTSRSIRETPRLPGVQAIPLCLAAPPTPYFYYTVPISAKQAPCWQARPHYLRSARCNPLINRGLPETHCFGCCVIFRIRQGPHKTHVPKAHSARSLSRAARSAVADAKPSGCWRGCRPNVDSFSGGDSCCRTILGGGSKHVACAFLAMGFFLMILGAQCLGVESVRLKVHDEPPASVSLFDTEPKVGDLMLITPPPWAPWSLLSCGAVVCLYSFTIPRRVAGG